MFVICIIEDEWSSYGAAIREAASRHREDALFCVLRAAYRARLEEADNEPIKDLLGVVGRCRSLAQKGEHNLIVNNRLMPLCKAPGDIRDSEHPPGLTPYALVHTLLKLAETLNASSEAGDWFFACDAQLEFFSDDDSDSSQRYWPVDGVPQIVTFENRLRASKKLALSVAVNVPFQAIGLFCAWLLQEEGLKASLLTSRFSEPDTREIIGNHVFKDDRWAYKIVGKAREALGVNRSWSTLAETSPGKLAAFVNGYQCDLDRKYKDFHNPDMAMAAASSTDKLDDIEKAASVGNSLLEELDCNDKDVLDALGEYKTNDDHALARVVAKTKAMASRAMDRLYLFDVLHYSALVGGSSVIINGQPASSLHDFSPVICDKGQFILSNDNIGAVLTELRNQGKLISHVVQSNAAIDYRLIYSPGDTRNCLHAHKLLCGDGDVARMLKAMRLLFSMDQPCDGEGSSEAIRVARETSDVNLGPTAPAGMRMFAFDGKLQRVVVLQQEYSQTIVSQKGVTVYVWPVAAESGSEERKLKMAIVGRETF